MPSLNEIREILPDNATFIKSNYEGVGDKIQAYWEYRGKWLHLEVTEATSFWSCRLDDWFSCWRIFGEGYFLTLRNQLDLFLYKIDEWIDTNEPYSN